MTDGSQRSLTLGGIGARLELRLSGSRVDELESQLRLLWERCLDPVAGVDAGSIGVTLADPDAETDTLLRGADDLASPDLDLLLLRTTQTITGRLIKARVGEVLMFHAGAVCHPVTGASLVFVAEGGTGKTTLARKLARHYGYLTDETVAITAENRILPYPKPLSMRQHGETAKREVAPSDLVGLPDGVEPWVARVVLLDRDDEHGHQPAIEELGLLDAIAAMTPETSSLHALPRGLHRCADLIGATGPVLRVRYSEATSLTPLVTELIGEAS